jgi:nitroreductase
LARIDLEAIPIKGNVVAVETWDSIRARRNVRAYQDREIPPQDLERILEAAWRTPSSMNEQPWDFVLCTDPSTLRQLAETWRYAQHVAGSAATVALVAPIPADQDSRDWVFYDMGQATMSMMLAATDLGIGSSHAALEDQALARKILGLPEDRFCVGLVAFGYPADRPLSPIVHPNRRPLSEVVHREHW